MCEVIERARIRQAKLEAVSVLRYSSRYEIIYSLDRLTMYKLEKGSNEAKEVEMIHP